MFRLLQNIFSTHDQRGSPYPDELVEAAIERVVDGTDPRLRVLPGYRRTLRPPVLATIDHVVALVEALPDPVPATAAGRDQDPALAQLFTSTLRMQEILAADPAWRAYRESGPLRPACGLLLVEAGMKQGFGYGLVNDQLVADLPQTTVSFDGHRLIDLADSEAETRRLLRRRAFDYLVSLALAAISERQEERADLTQRRALLRSKLDVLARCEGFRSPPSGERSATELQSLLDGIETQLAALGGDASVLPGNLAHICEVLSQPARQLWLAPCPLRIDHHAILHGVEDETVPATVFQQLHDCSGREMTLLLLNLPAPT